MIALARSSLMEIREPKDISAILLDDKLVEEALNAAVCDAVQLRKEKGLPLVVWRDGKTMWITPEEAERNLAASGKTE
jgi:hypothetical protein